MTYEELIQEARSRDDETLANDLRALAHDPRFGALLVLLERESRDYARGGSAQANAAYPGALAHAFGSIFGLDQFSDKLRGILDSPPPNARKSS